MRLSLIIPAYNEAGRIAHTVDHVCGYLDRQTYQWELIVVIDGDTQNAAAAARAATQRHAHARVIVNDVNRGKGFSVLLRVLYPACPHIAHGLWNELGFAAQLGELLDAPWPQVDEAALLQDQIELVLQIAGKTRGAIRVPAAADKAAIEAAALAAPEFAKFAEGKAVKKVVIVPGRLVNVVC